MRESPRSDSAIETKIPQSFETGTLKNTNAMGCVSLFVFQCSGDCLFTFCDNTRRNRILLYRGPSLGLVACCSSCCKLLFFKFATKPFNVTRNAKRPRHNHQIETAIHSLWKRSCFHMSPRCVSKCIWTCWYECVNDGFSSCWSLNLRMNNDALGFVF